MSGSGSFLPSALGDYCASRLSVVVSFDQWARAVHVRARLG
jgi:hypothetical protein